MIDDVVETPQNNIEINSTKIKKIELAYLEYLSNNEKEIQKRKFIESLKNAKINKNRNIILIIIIILIFKMFLKIHLIVLIKILIQFILKMKLIILLE